MTLDPEDWPDEEIQYARTMIACPWYQTITGQCTGGVCATGCYSEPACETGCPDEGWEAIAALPLPDDPS